MKPPIRRRRAHQELESLEPQLHGVNNTEDTDVNNTEDAETGTVYKSRRLERSKLGLDAGRVQEAQLAGGRPRVGKAQVIGKSSSVVVQLKWLNREEREYEQLNCKATLNSNLSSWFLPNSLFFLRIS